MALKNCRECNAEVSMEAKTCPKCGIAKPVKKASSILKVIIWIFGIGLLGNVISIAIGNKSAGKTATLAPADPAANAKEQVDKAKKDLMFNVATSGGALLKRAMKDPAAFELTSVVIHGDGGAVCYEYRAKNSFGAILPSSAVFTSKGKMLAREQDGNKFVSAWNKECTPAGGTDSTDQVNHMLSLMR